LGWSGKKPVCKYQIPDDAIVVFDDPSKNDFMRLKDFENRFADAMIDRKRISRTTIDRHEYFVKPNTLVKGYGFRTQSLVFTTTELITSQLIHSNYEKVYQPKLMPDQKMDAGNIHVLKTEMVRQRFDGLLPPIMERIKKEGFEFEYIADGQGNQYNLTNSKGQNKFVGKNTVVEISHSCKEEITRTRHELGWGKEDLFTIKLAIALDQVQQAIGRNCGYRWSDEHLWGDVKTDGGPTCIVLCEPHLYKEMLKNMRYAVTSTMDVDAYQKGSGKRQRDTLLNSITWFLQNHTTYICVGLKAPYRQFKDDVRHCLEACSPNRREARKKRLLNSLKQLCKNLSESYKMKTEGLIEEFQKY
jgi:hypothetical protein